MKKLNFLTAFIMLFAAIGFTSCDSEPVDPLLIDNGEQPSGPASFKVDFNGATYATDQATAMVNAGLISVTGIKMPSGESVTLTVPGTTTGTYNGADGAMLSYHSSLSATYYYMNVNPSLEDDPNGSITITSINTTNHTISGTFNFVGYRNDVEEDAPSITFTNGAFQNVPYTGTVGPQPESLFKVKIDGAQFTADDAQATMGVGLTSIAGFRGANGEYVAIVVNATAEGTYTDLAVLSYAASEDDDNVYSSLLIENAGTVTISDIDTVNHTISGTFSFNAINDADDEKAFTEGVFENVPYTTDNATGDIFKATVDGTAKDYANSVITSFIEGGTSPFINIQGVDTNGSGILLVISDDLGAGTYAISNEFGSDAKGFYIVDEDTTLSALEGSVTITAKEDGHIVGTFQYTIVDAGGGVPTHTITNGQFDVEY